MATAEEHYKVALDMVNNAGNLLNAKAQEGGVPLNDVLSLAALHIDLGRLRIEIDRPGRGLILPN